MKKPILLLVTGVFIAAIFQQDGHPSYISLPAPTNREEGEERIRREAWFELMHQSAAGTDWRQIEYANRFSQHEQRIQNLSLRQDCGVIAIADGQVQGEWQERGSNNQAGSIFDTEYDPSTNEIWTISAGGTLWRGPRDGSHWQVVNQDLQFNPGILQFVPKGSGRRLIAFAGRIPHYSDDDGYSWTAAHGIRYADSWGNFHKPVILNDNAHTFYFFAKPDYWSNIKLYKSINQGESFQAIKTFETSDFTMLSLCNPHFSNELLLIEKTKTGFAKISRINPQNNTFELLNQGNELKLEDAPANLVGWAGNQIVRLYAYASNDNGYRVHSTENYGVNWNTKGFLPAEPWEVGLYVLPSNPDALFMGEVECHRSLDGGNTWSKVNDWWAYYDDVENKLHADIMNLSEFIDNEGIPFLLISHHGGISISEDYFDSQKNISLTGLNTSQYYSVRTDPNNSSYVYAGSQDQGFQLANGFDTWDMEAFEQIISGDYGHIIFSNHGQSLWMVYPGGSVSYYANAQTGDWTANYELESDNESVWLPPLIPSPVPSENAIYMAGGNMNGGKGSYIIRLEASDNNRIQASQGAFDFKMQSGGGEISAMATSPINPDCWYAATTNGRFFYSKNKGQTWEQNLNFIPDGHYLYGQTIYPSKTTINTVYLGGSGYSNPGIYKSTDGGATFVAMSEGLPNTLVFGITANANESLLFAATEAGPYVYVEAEERWYNMSGTCAPAQTYWSVEFVESENLVRFGTYGRGIWDFQLDATVDTDDPGLVANGLKVFPNPSDGKLSINWLSINKFLIQIWNVNGQLIYQKQASAESNNIDLVHLPKGMYIVKTQYKQKTASAKLLLR
ncbi:MAG: T9SS type A sorting domain-containing protein [Saprospiraceae bacterium]|nr:T9SS type A sorting domain-containing protein [Saprospiraceae bacterium]